MRVLTFTTLFPNAQQPAHGVFVRERIRALAQFVDLRVVAPVPWFPRTRAFGDRYYRYALVPAKEEEGGLRVDHPRFPVIPRFCKGADALFLALGSLPLLRKLRDEFPYDIIDSHWAYPDGGAAAILAGQLGVPYSVTVRGDDINVFLKHAWRRPWIRWSLARADLVIALSRELKEILSASGVAPGKIAVIPNGINRHGFYRVERDKARAHLGLPAGGRIVLSVGRLHQSKGFPIVVETVGRLVHKFPDLQIYIVGSPDHEADARPAIHLAAARYKVTDRLHLVGAQDPALLKYWYSAADVFCLATSREGSANVLLEAMACGLPCITTPVGGNPDVVTSEELGILADPDLESMTIAVEHGLSRQWDAAKIAHYGASRTWETVARECSDHLLSTLEASNRRAL